MNNETLYAAMDAIKSGKMFWGEAARLQVEVDRELADREHYNTTLKQMLSLLPAPALEDFKKSDKYRAVVSDEGVSWKNKLTRVRALIVEMRGLSDDIKKELMAINIHRPPTPQEKEENDEIRAERAKKDALITMILDESLNRLEALYIIRENSTDLDNAVRELLVKGFLNKSQTFNYFLSKLKGKF